MTVLIQRLCSIDVMRAEQSFAEQSLKNRVN